MIWPLASSSRNSYIPVLSTDWGADCDWRTVREKTINRAAMAKHGDDMMPRNRFVLMVDTTVNVLYQAKDIKSRYIYTRNGQKE